MITLGHAVLEPMSLEEEINAPKNVKATRNNKLRMYGDLDHIIRLAEQTKRTVRQIPEKDDDRHAKMVSYLRDLVRKAELAMEDAAFYNGENIK